MTTSRDLILAIIAMDSYNHGYDPGIKVDASKIGSAEIISLANLGISDSDYQNWIAAGFYAIAYDRDGETVISIRGTDRLPGAGGGFEGAYDFWSYGIGIGQPFALTGGLTDQARLTIEFYRAVAGVDTDPFAADITLTGHSLELR